MPSAKHRSELDLAKQRISILESELRRMIDVAYTPDKDAVDRAVESARMTLLKGK